jgi:hypothetical protein
MWGQKRAQKRAKARAGRKADRARADRGPRGGTAAAYGSALDLTAPEVATKKAARLRTLRSRRRLAGATKVAK